MEGLFSPGTVLLGKYRIESVLGRGGMGMVVRVTHLHLGEDLALKILSPEAAAGGPDAHARFLREAQASVRLRGEHVTRVSDVGVLPEGAPYIAMEYLRGVDLSGELARRGTLSPGDTVDYVLQACEALAEAHALGIVHRDIKPSNLFLTSRPDGTPLVKVLDFGISKAPVAGPGLLTRTDTVMGTPGYMSPEQMKAARDVDARTDIWALGIVLYECLSGRRPFDAETFSAIVLRAATEPPPPMDPRIPRGLQAVVLRCLEKDRAARFPSMAALAAALAPFARDGRAAAIVVERTRAMLQGPSGAAAPGARFGERQSTTTLSGSTGVVPAQSLRHWYALVGTVLLVGAIAVVSAVSLSGSSQSVVSEAGSAVREVGSAVRDAGSADAGSANDLVEKQDRVDAGSAISATVNEPQAVGTVAEIPTVVTVDHPPVRPNDEAEQDKVQKAARCAELEVQKDWDKLRHCASELATLGAKDKAREFRAKAVKGITSSLAADKVQQALRDGNLQEAQKQLKNIDTDSVYFTKMSDALRSAETKAIDEVRRKAQALANAHDCADLKRFLGQLSTSSTSGVSAAAAAVKCVEQKQPADRTSDSDEPTTSKPPNTSCEKMDAYDLWRQAANQYTAGYAKSALSLMVRALACKQDVTTYRLAATYACAAHDQESAKLYFTNVPTQFQPAIIQRCQQEGISLP